MSPEPHRESVRLAILIGSIFGLVILGVSSLAGSSGGGGPTALEGAKNAPTSLHPSVVTRLPTVVHANAVASTRYGPVVVGGLGANGAATDLVERFDPLSLRVRSFGSLAQPLQGAAATSLNGRVFVFGGMGKVPLAGVEVVNSKAKATMVGRLPTGLSGLSAVTVKGAIYLVGGYDGKRPTAAVYQTTDGKSFTRVARLPTPVRSAATAAIGSEIYVFGGQLANGQDTNQIQEYNIAKGHAVIAGHLPQPLSQAAAVTLEGAMYVLGGRIGRQASDRILRFVPLHNTTRHTVGVNVTQPAGHLPQPVYDGGAGVFDNQVYLIGGLGARGALLSTVMALR